MTQLTAAPDVSPADWIVDALQTFAESVLSLVPSGFDAYVRVFHPARRLADGVEVPVPWAEIAARNGTHANAGMQLFALTRGIRTHDRQPGVYDVGPEVGSLPAVVAGPLTEVLARHTTAPERCWFAVWHGFGATRADIRTAPTFQLPNREYHLLVGAVDAVKESVCNSPASQSPNLWWPHDRTWCVATEIDLDTTYIACTASCRDDLADRHELEAMPIDPATGITIDSDPVNPFPDPSSGGGS